LDTTIRKQTGGKKKQTKHRFYAEIIMDITTRSSEREDA